MLVLALAVDDRELDPAKVEGIARGPDHGFDAGTMPVELLRRIGNGGQIRTAGVRCAVDRERPRVGGDIGVDLVPKTGGGVIAMLEAGGESLRGQQTYRGRRAPGA